MLGGGGGGARLYPPPYKCVKFHGFVEIYLPSDLFECITFKLILDCEQSLFSQSSLGLFSTFDCFARFPRSSDHPEGLTV